MPELSTDPQNDSIATFLLGTVGGDWYRREIEGLDFTVYDETTIGQCRSIRSEPSDLDPDRIEALSRDLKRLSQDSDLVQHLIDGKYDTLIARARAFLVRVSELVSAKRERPVN